MKTEYQLKHAREILEPCNVLGEYLLLDDRGVWPAVERDMTMQHETELLRWQPADELQDLPDAPEASETPMLPMPFTARQLAAFMLSGMGAHVADFYGDWCDGPDPESLNEIDPKSHARLAVVEAFAAYRLAQEKVGELDLTAQTRRDAAHKAYRQEPSNKALLKKFDEAQAAWDAAYTDWLTKMVRCLLVPEVAPQAAQVAPASDAGQGAPVAESAPLPVSGLIPLTTGDIAHAFDGLRWSEAKWKKPLGDKRKWLAGCIAIPGKQGVSETRWNPVLIAAELVRQDHVKASQVRAKFQNVHQLKPWLDAWKTYEADTFDTR